MNIETFLISSIIEITKDRLIFTNNKNQLQEIDFYECRKNWVEYFNNNEFVTFEGDPVPKTSMEENTCVGERDWFFEKPYYEFYSNPKIRFEIHPKKRLFDYLYKYWHQRYYPEFCKVDSELHKVGLCTFDLG